MSISSDFLLILEMRLWFSLLRFYLFLSRETLVNASVNAIDTTIFYGTVVMGEFTGRDLCDDNDIFSD